ncbi:hypothetical protein Q9Q94_15680 [Uliginosibacterium sp. 31-16]|uniref:hypothetical protein n=1 Tax=Uliginosibacterium sp. 31-16 TaxID=3068315 RepID=UPI00273E736D|nr:hypothetical protein [Uliginosibacterium sp. 31-16]MDP5240982.1 hypothetical protein [Uliginosibacterium sp. 31-16]
MAAQDYWHYPRTALADSVLMAFDSGLSHALTMFAPRRMGKTEFLLKDIAPRAEEHGWRVFYHSFMTDGDEAGEVFRLSLAEFAAGRMKSWLKPLTARVSAELLGVKAEFASQPASPQHSLTEIVQALASAGKTILLLDEAQILTRLPRNEELLGGLRTGLDINKDQLKVLFTGSSREGLRRMFSEARAPFFHFGTNIELPTLERGFCVHLAEAYRRSTGRPLDEWRLWEEFEAMGHVPGRLRAVVEAMVLNAELTLAEAVALKVHDIHDEVQYAKILKALPLLDRLVLQAVLASAPLFAEDTRTRIGITLGSPPPSTTAVQSAAERLLRDELITRRERGQYEISDPGFAQWLNALATTKEHP